MLFSRIILRQLVINRWYAIRAACKMIHLHCTMAKKKASSFLTFICLCFGELFPLPAKPVTAHVRFVSWKSLMETKLNVSNVNRQTADDFSCAFGKFAFAAYVPIAIQMLMSRRLLPLHTAAMPLSSSSFSKRNENNFELFGNSVCLVKVPKRRRV